MTLIDKADVVPAVPGTNVPAVPGTSGCRAATAAYDRVAAGKRAQRERMRGGGSMVFT